MQLRTKMRISPIYLSRQQVPAAHPEELETLSITTEAWAGMIATAGGAELHHLSASMARRYLASHHESINERSQLFEDLRQFALSCLSTVRVSRSVPTVIGNEVSRRVDF